MSNLSDFYGGGLPRLGEYVSPVTGTLADLSDVKIVSPISGYTLRYEGGYWVSNKLLYSDLLGTPSIPTMLKNLTDVDPGLAPTNGQILKYNNSNSRWEAITQPAGTLSSLSDVTLGTLSATQSLYYNGTAWVNKKLDYTTDIANTPTIPVNNSFTFVGLSDTNNSVVNSGFLRWNVGGSQIDYQATIPTTDITGLAAIATSPVINNITGFIVSSPAAGQVLSYSGGNWINASVPKTNRIQDGTNATFVDVAQTANSVVVQAGTNGSILLNPAGSGQVVIAGSGSAVISSNDPISLTSPSTIAIHGIVYPSTDGTAGQVLVTNGSGLLGFATPASTGATHLYQLLDVTISSNVAGHVIVDDGAGNWTSQFLTFSGDVTNSGLVLSIGNNKVTNAMLATMPASTFKGNKTGGIANAGDMTATEATALLNVATSGSNNPGLKGLVPPALLGDITKFLRGDMTWQTVSGGGGSTTLSGLTDTNIVSPAANQILIYNTGSSKWVNQQLDYSQLTNLPALKSVATTGNFSSLLDTPGSYAGNANKYVQVNPGATGLIYTTLPSYLLTVSADLTPQLGGNLNVNGKDIVSVSNGNIRIIPNGTGYIQLGTAKWPTTSGSANQVLKTNGTDASWGQVAFSELSGVQAPAGAPDANKLVMVNGAGTALVLTNPGYLTNITSQVLDNLQDVVAPTPSNGQVLTFNGSNWVPNTPASGSRIQDSNNNTFVDVSTNDNVAITAGPDSVTGGNIVLTPNTTLNASAGVVVNGTGDAYISSTNNIVLSTPANVSIQNLVYPNVDGANKSYMMTDGSGNLSLSLRSVTLRYDRVSSDVNLNVGSTPLPSGWTETSLTTTSTTVTITHSRNEIANITVWGETGSLGTFKYLSDGNVSSTDILNSITLDLSTITVSGKVYVKFQF